MPATAEKQATATSDDTLRSVTLPFSTALRFMNQAHETMLTPVSSFMVVPGCYTVHSPHTYHSHAKISGKSTVVSALGQEITQIGKTADWMRTMTMMRNHHFGRMGSEETVTPEEVENTLYTGDCISTSDVFDGKKAAQISQGYRTVRRFMQTKGITAKTPIAVKEPSVERTMRTFLSGHALNALSDAYQTFRFQRRVGAQIKRAQHRLTKA